MAGQPHRFAAAREGVRCTDSGKTTRPATRYPRPKRRPRVVGTTQPSAPRYYQELEETIKKQAQAYDEALEGAEALKKVGRSPNAGAARTR